MQLEELISLAVESYYPCKVWDNKKEETVYEGAVEDIPDNILNNAYITSWELSDDGCIIFNIDLQ